MAGTVYGFNNQNDVDRVLKMLADYKSNQRQQPPASHSVRQEARYAKIKTILPSSVGSEHNDKEATAVQAVWDPTIFDFAEVVNDPIIYDNDQVTGSSATVFNTNNIVSKTAMAVDDIVLLQKYPNINGTAEESPTAGWLVVETGGGGTEFGTCTIVSEIENPMGPGSQYVANVKPGNPKLSQSGTVPKGIVYLKFGITTPVAVGAELFTALYPSTQPVEEGEDPIYKYDCIPIETLYNLIAPPEEEEPPP